MDKKKEYRRIYRIILDTVDNSPSTRQEIIGAVIDAVLKTDIEKQDSDTNSSFNVTRSLTGTIINEMHRRRILSLDSDGRYAIVEDKPIALRIER